MDHVVDHEIPIHDTPLINTDFVYTRNRYKLLMFLISLVNSMNAQEGLCVHIYYKRTQMTVHHVY